MRQIITLLFCCLVCCSAFADDVVYYVAKDNVRLLQSYDAEAATLGILPKGTPINVVGSTFASLGLYDVKVQGVRGYMFSNDLSDKYIERTDNSKINVSSKPLYRAVRSTRLLQSFDENSAIVARIEQDETLQITGSTFASLGLFEAKYDGKKGYVLARDIEFLNRSSVRAMPSASAVSSSGNKVVKQERKSQRKTAIEQSQEKDEVEPDVAFDEEYTEDEDFSVLHSLWDSFKVILYVVILVLALLVYWCVKKLREEEYYDEESGVQPPSHIVLSIFTFIFFSRILGLIAFIFALMVNDRWNCGNIDGANSASHTAKNLCYAAIVIVLSLLLLGALAVVVFV